MNVNRVTPEKNSNTGALPESNGDLLDVGLSQFVFINYFQNLSDVGM
jgi:hypothetical protein